MSKRSAGNGPNKEARRGVTRIDGCRSGSETWDGMAEAVREGRSARLRPIERSVLKLEPPFDSIEAFGNSIDLGLQVSGHFRISRLIPTKRQYRAMCVVLSDLDILEFAFDTIHRRLKSLQMFKDNVLDVLGHERLHSTIR